MKKGTIIIGPKNSGKTDLAFFLANLKGYTEAEITLMNGRTFSDHPFNFSACTPDTNLIIIDDVASVFEFERLYNCIGEEAILVQKPRVRSFVITPDIIITCQSDITSDMLRTDACFTNRFDIVDITPTVEATPVLLLFQINSCDECFYLIASSVDHSKQLFADQEPNYVETAEDVFNFEIIELTEEQAAEKKIYEADFDRNMESEYTTLLDYYHTYTGTGELVGSSLYID